MKIDKDKFFQGKNICHVGVDQGNMKRWKKTRPYKREYVVDGATFYMSLSKTMIVLGNSDGLAKILWQDTGEEVWTMQCEDIAVQQEALAHRLHHLQHLTAC